MRFAKFHKEMQMKILWRSSGIARRDFRKDSSVLKREGGHGNIYFKKSTVNVESVTYVCSPRTYIIRLLQAQNLHYAAQVTNLIRDNWTNALLLEPNTLVNASVTFWTGEIADRM